MNLEARNDLADKLQHQRIDDENEQAERHQNQRNAQKQQNRPDKSVDDPEQQRGAQQATNSGVIDPHDRRRYKHCERRDEPSKNEMPHGACYWKLQVSPSTVRHSPP